MKKSLFALAAATAFTGLAQAQSSVTVYGVFDMGYLGSSTIQRAPGIGGAAASATNSINTLSQQVGGIAGGGQSTSRLGFRGVEDIGGGLSAFFTLEAAINESANGIISTSSTGNRLAFVGLGKKGLGTVQAGINYTPMFEEVGVTDAGAQNNVGGNVIHDRAGGIGSTSNNSGASTTGITRSGMSTNDSYMVRASNSAVFKTERISGVQLKAMVIQAGMDSNAQSGTSGVYTGNSNNSGYGASLSFNGINNLYVTAAYSTVLNTGTAGVGSFAPGYNGGGINVGTLARDNQQYYAASYDFGKVQGYLQYVSRNVVSELASSNYVKRTAQQIGVRSQATPTVLLWASVGQGKINPNGSGITPAKFTGYQVGSQYNLSKRTNLYAIAGGSNTSNSANGAYAAAPTTVSTTAAPYSANQISYAVGVRHTF